MGNDQVQEIKSKTDIVSIIGERIELKRAGRNFKANCPFHGERTPSFMVSPELQIFKCFGCGESGDVFTFLEKYEGMDFSETLKFLAEKAGVVLKEFVGKNSGEKERLLKINEEVLKFYNYSLLSHEIGKKALEYLVKERGLKMEIIKEFQLGYSPENSLLLKEYLVTKKKLFLDDIQKAGVANIRGSSFYDRFSGRVIFPLFDHRGNTIGFAGRVLPWSRQDTAKYINSPDTPIYHKSHVLYGLNITRSFIKKKGIAIIVEGELDAISSYQAGIKNVVAIKGSALTEDQVRLLSRFAQKFIIALDADLAGDSASRRGITVATNLGIEVKVARLKKFKDPDEAARHDLLGYKKSLIEATNIWDFFVESIFGKYDAKSAQGSIKITKEIIPILGEIENKILQAQYIGIVAKKLDVPTEAVVKEIEKITKKEDTKDNSAEILSPADRKKDRKDLLEDRYLSLILKSSLKDLKKDLITSVFNIKIADFLFKNNNLDISQIAQKLPAELRSGFNDLVFLTNDDLDKNEIRKEILLVEKELNILILKGKLQKIAGEIEILEQKGDILNLEKAQSEFSSLAAKLSGFEES